MRVLVSCEKPREEERGCGGIPLCCTLRSACSNRRREASCAAARVGERPLPRAPSPLLHLPRGHGTAPRDRSASRLAASCPAAPRRRRPPAGAACRLDVLSAHRRFDLSSSQGSHGLPHILHLQPQGTLPVLPRVAAAQVGAAGAGAVPWGDGARGRAAGAAAAAAGRRLHARKLGWHAREPRWDPVSLHRVVPPAVTCTY